MIDSMSDTNKNSTANSLSAPKLILADGLLFALLIFLDQITKIRAEEALKGQTPFPIIRGVLELYYLQNTGAAFSMLENAQWFFVIVALIAIGFIAFLLVRMPRTKRMLPLHLTILFIAAGAAGNLIDRVLYQYVRDFIYFSLINFPVFNVADIYVTCATALLIVLILFHYKDDEFSFMPGASVNHTDSAREDKA